MYPKAIDDLTLIELATHSVWEFAIEDEGNPDQDETWVSPVTVLPVDDVSNGFVSAFVTLANGDRVQAIIGGLDLKDPYKTRVFMGITILEQARRFHLVRYFDVDYDRNGPDGLSRFLGLPVEAIFPISYDLSHCLIGSREAIKGSIPAEPAERLSDDQISALMWDD